MKGPRITLASIGIVILILAIDFAIVRAALLNNGPDPWPIFALGLLPMLDVLLVSLYRLRQRAQRTAGAIGFTIVGSAGTITLFATGLIAPEPVLELISAICRPVARTSVRELTRLLGNAAIQSRPMELTLVIAFEILLPVALFCAPPLIIAVLGGQLARRARAGRPMEVATIG